MKAAIRNAFSIASRVGFGAAGFSRSLSAERPMPDLASVRSILVIRLNLLGDLIFTLPAMAALTRAAPHARITMLVLPYTASLLKGVDFVDRVVTADVNRWRTGKGLVSGNSAREVARVVRELRSEPYDLCVSFYGEVGSAFSTMSGARFTAGYASEGYPMAFDLALPGRRYDERRHEAEYCLDLVRALGASGDATLPHLSPNQEASRRVGDLLDGMGISGGESYVTLHAGALNMSAKRWPAARWAAVADRLQREVGARVILVGSASERPLAELVASRMETRPVVLTGETSIPELAALIARSSLFMGGDSGPLHLASALSIPSVSIYGPTDPANTGPLHGDSVVLRGSAPCAPCYDLRRPATCWRGDLLCMSQVPPDEVFEAARDPLSRTGQKVPAKPPDIPVVSTASTIAASSYSTVAKRILVVKLAGLGDLLTAFPALEALRAHHPLAEITALVTPHSAPLLDGSGLVDRVMSFDKYQFDAPAGFGGAASLMELGRLSARLRSLSFDATILLHHFITWQGVAKYGLLTAAAGSPVRAGLDDGRGRFLSHRAPDLGFGAKHEVEYWLDVVSLLGATAPNPSVRWRVSESEERYADLAWKKLGLDGGASVVALHPGTGSYSPVRRWPPARFSAVANALADGGLTPMIVAGPGEESLAREVADGVRGPCVILDGTPTVRDLGAILSRCTIYVGNDSGVTHVAAAAGVRTVAVFGPSNHLAWAPYDPAGNRTRVVRRDLECSPCLYRGLSLGLRNGCGDPVCLTGIAPSAVVAAARELLTAGD